MATIIAFPITKRAPSRNRWSAEEDLHAEIIELSDFRPVPAKDEGEWRAFAPFRASLRAD